MPRSALRSGFASESDVVQQMQPGMVLELLEGPKKDAEMVSRSLELVKCRRKSRQK